MDDLINKLRTLDEEHRIFDISKLGNLESYGLYRGNPLSKVMIVGEALGKDEAVQHSPFVGKAGILLDRIFASVGLDTNKDCFLTNLVPYRPVAPEGSGKQNLAPTKTQIEACKYFLDKQIEIIQPEIIVLLGKVAMEGVLGYKKPISKHVGLWALDSRYPGIRFYIMYHPAFLLHSQRDIEQYQTAREAMWLHIRKLRNKVDLLRGNELTYPLLETTN